MINCRYRAHKDNNGTWSVIDTETGEAATLRGVLLIGLGEELANDMAELLRLEMLIEIKKGSDGS
jgi:hypothetical protein